MPDAPHRTEDELVLPPPESGTGNVAIDVLVIGAGQTGLSAAYHLQRTGSPYLVLDSETGPGGAWQHRWPTLTMSTVNGITELPGSVVPPVDPAAAAADVIPKYFSDYETHFGLDVRRPITVGRVESNGTLLVSTMPDGRTVTSRADQRDGHLVAAVLAALSGHGRVHRPAVAHS